MGVLPHIIAVLESQKENLKEITGDIGYIVFSLRMHLHVVYTKLFLRSLSNKNLYLRTRDDSCTWIREEAPVIMRCDAEITVMFDILVVFIFHYFLCRTLGQD